MRNERAGPKSSCVLDTAVAAASQRGLRSASSVSRATPTGTGVLALRRRYCWSKPQANGGFAGHDRYWGCQHRRPFRIVFYAGATAYSAPIGLSARPQSRFLETGFPHSLCFPSQPGAAHNTLSSRQRSPRTSAGAEPSTESPHSRLHQANPQKLVGLA